ncbi:putative MutS domain protein [Peptoniphilus sp. ING2-D1G]|nr:putative MutS domain protein [Peptoniphilus sp. ING2-D1G]
MVFEKQKITLFLLVGAMILFIVTYSCILNRKNLKYIKHKVDRDFGKNPSDIKIDKKILKKLFENTVKGKYFLDDISANDINLDLVFEKYNHANTTVGAQYLYMMLRMPIFNKEYHDKLKDVILKLSEDIDAAKKLSVEFAKIGYFKRDVLDIIYDGIDYERYKKYKIPVYILTFSLVFLAVIYFVSKSFFGYSVIILLACGIYVSLKMEKATEGRILDFATLADILQISKEIEKIHISILKEDMEKVNKLNKDLSGIRRRTGQLSRFGTGSDVDFIIKILDVLVMYTPRKFFKTAELINENSEKLKDLYLVLGKMDAYLSLSSLYLSSDFTFAEYSTQKNELIFEKLNHPLLDENQVSVDADFTDINALITGSNYSGKSTFLRKIALATNLAMTIGFVPAKKYRTSFYFLQTSIDIKDSIEESISYFLAETLTIKRMIEKSDIKKLLVLDEIFRGTNTIDRISAACNTLKYLSKENKVFAATHDIELTELLKEEFKNYHFEEEIKDKDITFDYKLKDGPSKTRNAIEILNIKGYPEEIIVGAKKMAEEISRNKQIKYKF